MSADTILLTAVLILVTANCIILIILAYIFNKYYERNSGINIKSVINEFGKMISPGFGGRNGQKKSRLHHIFEFTCINILGMKKKSYKKIKPVLKKFCE